MTNKGKVLAAVIAVVVVLAGGVGLYLKGGDLMGKLIPLKPANVSSCVSGTTVYDSEAKGGAYGSFSDFVKAVKNGTLRDCNYNFQGGDTDVDGFIAKCSKSDLYAFLATGQNPATVSCSKKVGSDFFRFDLYENNALVNLHMDQMDTDTFGMTTYKAYEPFEVRVE